MDKINYNISWMLEKKMIKREKSALQINFVGLQNAKGK